VVTALAGVVAELGPERLCYGSLAHGTEDGAAPPATRALADPEVRHLVLSGNATRLFGLKAA
jgi:hypothetical protein